MLGRFVVGEILCRPLSIDDVESIWALLDSEAQRFIPEIQKGKSRDEWIKGKLSESGKYLCHVLEVDGNIVGYIQLIDGMAGILEDRYSIEIGIIVHSKCRNRKIATKVIGYLTNNLVESNNWTQDIVAWIYTGNVKSEKLFTRLGFIGPVSSSVGNGQEKRLFVYRSKHLRKEVGELILGGSA